MSERGNDTKGPASLEELRALVGVFSALRPTVDDVNLPMIRHWCEAMSDENPAYTDAAFAAMTTHGGIVAPPSMLDTWMNPGLRPRNAQLSEAGEPVGMVPFLEGLDAAGFTAIVATNTAHEYDRYLRLGDRLSVRAAVTKLSDEKQTALGPGHFMTAVTEFVDQNGERVGRMEFRVLKFKPEAMPSAADFVDAPASKDAGATSPPQPARPRRRDTTRRFEDVKVGVELAPCPVPITATLIVSGAIASQDFEGVHHDVEIARERGAPNIFMNIFTTGGLTSRYVTDWAGPEAIVRNMKIRLGIPNFPGDVMTFTGEVTAVEMRSGVGAVEVGVRGANGLGDHVSGTLELELPIGR